MHSKAGTETTQRRSDKHDPDDRITLSQAARIAPGKISPNCVWRWCRRGVLARSGERKKLQHIRVGGKLYTTPRWIEEFGARLAEADAEYFEVQREVPQRRTAPKQRTRRTARNRNRIPNNEWEAERHARVAAELEAEGL